MASNYDKCIKQVVQLAKKSGAFKQEEAQDLFQRLKEASARMGQVSADKKLQGLRDAAGEFTQDALINAMYRKVQMAHDAGVEVNFDAAQLKAYSKDPASGFKAFLTGSEALKEGGHDSVAANIVAARHQAMEPVFDAIKDIKTPDGTKSAGELAAKGLLDRRIVDKIANMTDNNIKVRSFDPHTDAVADQVAEILKNAQNKGTNLLRVMGINVNDLKGRVTRQDHPADALLSMGKEKWIQLAKDTFHPDTFAGKDDVNRFLDSFYDAASSGVRKSWEGKPTGAYQSYANLGQRLSSQRLVKFKDNDAYMAYRQATGQTNPVFMDILREIDGTARNAALINKMGSNPGKFMDDMKAKYEVMYRTDDANKKKLQKTFTAIDNRMKVLTGYTNIDTNPSLQGAVDGVRTYVALCTQPLSVLTSLPDVAQGINYLSHWGQGTFSSLGDFARSWSDHFGITKGSAWEAGQKATYALCEEFFMKNAASMRDGSGYQGWNKKALTWMYEKNQQFRFDENMKYAASNAVARIMGDYSHLSLDQIKDRDFKNSMLKYGVTSDMWDTMRQGVWDSSTTGTRKYLTAQGIQELIPEKSIISYLQSQGKTPSPYAIERARNELAMKASVISTDAGNHTVTLAGVNEQAIMTQGLQKGTMLRAALDLVTHFKGYALASSYRTFASMVYGRGANSTMEALMNKNGELTSAVQMIAVGMAAYYIGDTAKSALLGLTPRSIDPDHPIQSGIKNGLTLLAGSGGLGAYADLLTHDFGSDSSQALGLVAGPTVGRLSQGAALAWKSTVDQLGSRIEGEKAQKFPLMQDMHYATRNVPGISLPPVRAAVNYMLLQIIKDNLDPKAEQSDIDRNKRIKADSGQVPFLFPTQAK